MSPGPEQLLLMDLSAGTRATMLMLIDIELIFIYVHIIISVCVDGGGMPDAPQYTVLTGRLHRR